MGFCRNNLFKRLESSGYAFLHSVERHILRSDVFLYAIENGRELPVGPQDIELLDTRRSEKDVDDPNLVRTLDDDRHRRLPLSLPPPAGETPAHSAGGTPALRLALAMRLVKRNAWLLRRVRQEPAERWRLAG